MNAGTHTSAVLLRLDPDETDEEQTQVGTSLNPSSFLFSCTSRVPVVLTRFRFCL